MNKVSINFNRFLKCSLIGIVTGIANGLFGSGGGTIAVPSMVLILGEEDHKAHATAISIILPLTLVSSFFYVMSGFVNWSLTGQVMIGGVIGGYIGAKLLNICPTGILRKAFALFMILGAIRMIM
ncbi:MAG: sulfite exporter TauE/SafE family protein [Clostridia bacterium]|nr:sulfite exporter TauE/SafE family protein [Clostridia bacterium]